MVELDCSPVVYTALAPGVIWEIGHIAARKLDRMYNLNMYIKCKTRLYHDPMSSGISLGVSSQ